ncbi:MAG: hypothetical protein Q9162_001214 [Coniocarpon cinnabarinum]
MAALANAHYTLEYPPARGFDEDMEPQYPCGGFNSISSNRTKVPIGSAFPVQLNLHHTASLITAAFALGNNPQPQDFTTLLMPTVQERGPQNFCLGGIMIPENVSGTNGTLMPGMNGTLQLQTNGDPSGGLYQCADITFVAASSYRFDSANCKNSTGVNAQAVQSDEQGRAANGTAYGGEGVNPSMTTPAPASESSSAAAIGRASVSVGSLMAVVFSSWGLGLLYSPF